MWCFESGQKIKVSLTQNDKGDSTATYTISKGETAVAVGDVVAEFTENGTQALTFSKAEGETYAGAHTETLTFGISVESASTPVTAITLNKTATTIYKVNDSSTETLSVTAVTPDEATDKTYTWSSDATGVATVDENGKVTAVAAGTAHIRATTNDGSGVYGECTVTVTDLSAYYSKMVECGCDELDGKCAGWGENPFTGQVLSATQAIALAQAKAAETDSNCAVFYDGYSYNYVSFAKNDGTTGSEMHWYSAADKGLSGYKGYYVSK